MVTGGTNSGQCLETPYFRFTMDIGSPFVSTWVGIDDSLFGRCLVGRPASSICYGAPNGWVYIEIVAPDFRFLFAIGLAVVTLIFLLRRRVTANVVRNAAAMFALTTFSFVVWMATTGNGRYFMPYLVAIGPLCVGLVYTWKCSRSMKAIVVALLTGIQGFALYQNNPWEPFDSWESVPWIESPYFSIDF
jgi:hypothetical protein